MFDLPCGVRLRAFKQPSETPLSTSDIDHILAMYNNTKVAPLLTRSLIVPQGQKFKDRFTKAIDDAEMLCVIETIPSSSKKDTNEQPQIQTPAKSEVESDDTSHFVGFVALWPVTDRGHRHSSLGIAIIPEYQNKGFGTAIVQFIVDYAFVHLNMHRVSLSAIEGNNGALAVYRKCGFVQEGCTRKAVWLAGKWKDTIEMGILIDDWKAPKP